ncbi:MAG: cytidine deaminase [Treponema sp.]|jgi:cytidine deaminase|nr:cytidine deaminase [Treponema sp.]
MGIEELFEKAREAARFAYAPYSKFRVGAALVADDGSVWTGCNVENCSYGLAICAERNAVFQAVAAGRRLFTAIAIAALDSTAPVAPCGACRQVLSEFMGQDAVVFFGGTSAERVTTTLGHLLPSPFGCLNTSQRAL